MPVLVCLAVYQLIDFCWVLLGRISLKNKALFGMIF